MKKLLKILFVQYHEGTHFVKEANRFYVSMRVTGASIILAVILVLIFGERAKIAGITLYCISSCAFTYGAFLYFRYERYWRLDDKHDNKT